MPEGDTVFQAADRLRRALSGHVLEHSDFRIPTLATTDLTGATVTAVRSRGKHLLIDVTRGDPLAGGGDLSIHTHLKMEGVWHVHRVGSRWRRPAHTARLVLRANGYEAVGFNLGTLEILSGAAADLDYLGPDLLADDFDAARAVANLSAHPSTPIGLALLDQQLLAGIGNVYRCEACFLTGILPYRPISQVRNLPALVDLCRRLLWENRNRPIRTITGHDRPGQRTWVYGRGGNLCRRCATIIRREQFGHPDHPEERVIYFCPSCQR
ncbi:MAG: DNA-formamidopyrimidine glycosylase family protein [Gordonia sp. (in: high G+C Gram-positive bacteria)]